MGAEAKGVGRVRAGWSAGVRRSAVWSDPVTRLGQSQAAECVQAMFSCDIALQLGLKARVDIVKVPAKPLDRRAALADSDDGERHNARSVRPLVDRQYLGQLAVVREPNGSVGRHRFVTLDGDSDTQYPACRSTAFLRSPV
jgi:hypothetical protein